jgi:methylglyoxal reductase
MSSRSIIWTIQPKRSRPSGRYCLHRAGNAAVLTGFTTPEQVTQNLTPPAHSLTGGDLDFIRDTAGDIQQRLDAAGEVFLDEMQAPRP